MAPHSISFGILSSSPPTPCGIATFTTALSAALVRQGAEVRIVRILDDPEARPDSLVPIIEELIASDRSSIIPAIRAVNSCDVAIIQHEYGLYGGSDGDDVLSVLEGLRVPSIAILHTVLPHPTTHQLEVLNEVIRRVDGVVVMSKSARDVLCRVYEVRSDQVSIIPHGAAVERSPMVRTIGDRPMLLTWGLIGPGKGIEWAIDAMATLKDLNPKPLYVIAGRTHPKVLAFAGDAYRESLIQRVADNGVDDMVSFDNSYRSQLSLHQLIARSDFVVLPYDSREQATSGVLVDAVAAGRPVIATAFPHALELLRTGAGIVVEHQNVGELSAALRRALTEPAVALAMQNEAKRIAPSLSWDTVGSRFRDLAAQVLQRVGADA